MKINRKVLLVTLFACFMNVCVVKADNLKNIDNFNKDDEVDNFENTSNSYLEANYRTKCLFSDAHGNCVGAIDSPKSDETTWKFYPRVKKIGDYYILTYQGNDTSIISDAEKAKDGGAIYYSISSDLINWSTPIKLWEPVNIINDGVKNDPNYGTALARIKTDNSDSAEFQNLGNNGVDRLVFTNCELFELKDGSIMAYSSFRSKYFYRSLPYANGLVTKIGKLEDGKITWEESEETIVDKVNGSGNKTGTYNFGNIIYRGPNWEAKAIYNNNDILMYFSSAEPINSFPKDYNSDKENFMRYIDNPNEKKYAFAHSSSGVGLIISHDNGKHWTNGKFAAYKYTGTYSGKTYADYTKDKTINYYTAQMPAAVKLNDGKIFMSYEMWSLDGTEQITDESRKLPERYSISSSLYSSDYDWKEASGITTEESITNSYKQDPVTGDPKGKNDYSGNLKGFTTVAPNGGSAPALLQFPSGEVILSYHASSEQYLSVMGYKQISNLVWHKGFIDKETGEITTNDDYPNAWYTDLIELGDNITYQLGGYGTYKGDKTNDSGIRWRIYDTNDVFLGDPAGTTSGPTYTTSKGPRHVRLLYFNNPTADQMANSFITVGTPGTLAELSTIKLFGGSDSGYWGSVEADSSHSLISVFRSKEKNKVVYEKVYLNHAITGNYCSSSCDDAYLESISDALFIGSESQAQASIRARHDNDNIYFYVDVLDRNVNDNDWVELYLSTTGVTYDYLYIQVKSNNAHIVKTFKNGTGTTISSGVTVTTTNNNTGDIDNRGYAIKITISKEAVDLTNNYLKVNAILNNNDDGDTTQDTFSNVNVSDTSTWLGVNLRGAILDGDVTGDGVVNEMDADEVAKYIINKKGTTEIKNIFAVDTNKDTKIKMNDVMHAYDELFRNSNSQ